MKTLNSEEKMKKEEILKYVKEKITKSNPAANVFWSYDPESDTYCLMTSYIMHQAFAIENWNCKNIKLELDMFIADVCKDFGLE